jgi:predicted SprT family Zn-dependent metalloprotease
MNAEQTADLARKLLDTHGLHFWQFEFNRQKRSLGLCYFPSPSYPGRISLSKHFIELNSHEKIRETLLHEIAHALSWERHRYKGHGKIWKEIARQIGCVPERCCNDTDLIMPEIVHHTIYTATCSLCSKNFKKYRLHKNLYYYCKDCGIKPGSRLEFRRQRSQ